jgi:hypothetical protein
MRNRLKGWAALATLLLASCETAEPPERAPPALRPLRTEESVPLSSLRLVKDASISWRHYSISGVDLPAEGMSIAQRCWINREAGRLYICARSSTVPPIEARTILAADNRIAQMHFDVSGLPPPTADVTVTDITIHLSPKDRVELTPPASLRPESDMKWVRQPDSAAIERALWPTWRARVGGERAEVRMRCQIQTDLSVICADLRAIPEPVDTTPFGMKLDTRLATQYLSSLTLADGSPAAGAWVEIVVVSDAPPVTVPRAPPPPPRP